MNPQLRLGFLNPYLLPDNSLTSGNNLYWIATLHGLRHTRSLSWCVMSCRWAKYIEGNFHVPTVPVVRQIKPLFMRSRLMMHLSSNIYLLPVGITNTAVCGWRDNCSSFVHFLLSTFSFHCIVWTKKFCPWLSKKECKTWLVPSYSLVVKNSLCSAPHTNSRIFCMSVFCYRKSS